VKQPWVSLIRPAIEIPDFFDEFLVSRLSPEAPLKTLAYQDLQKSLTALAGFWIFGLVTWLLKGPIGFMYGIPTILP